MSDAKPMVPQERHLTRYEQFFKHDRYHDSAAKAIAHDLIYAISYVSDAWGASRSLAVRSLVDGQDKIFLDCVRYISTFGEIVSASKVNLYDVEHSV